MKKNIFYDYFDCAEFKKSINNRNFETDINNNDSKLQDIFDQYIQENTQLILNLKAQLLRTDHRSIHKTILISAKCIAQLSLTHSQQL